MAASLLLLSAVLVGTAPVTHRSVKADTLRLEVGSPEVDLSRMEPHFARVVVERLVDGAWQPVVEWTNRLEVGDSAGRAVHRWTTIGTGRRPNGESVTWHLYQTFDKTTIAPLGVRMTSNDGSETQLSIEGRRVRGVRKAGSDGATTPVDIQLSRAAYPSGATDLVPSGVKLREGLVMTFPAWQMGMPDVETRVFTVVGRREIPIAGKPWNTWAVEERAIRGAAVTFIGTWYLADIPPYMVYAETVGPNGSKQRMTEVLIPAQ